MTTHKTYLEEVLAAYKTVDIATLKIMINGAQTELKVKEDAIKAQSAAELLALFDKTGMSVKDVTDLLKKRRGVKVPGTVKFRHPSNPNWTWTGKGKHPEWVSKWLEQHGTLDAVRVPNPDMKQAA
jgi:DNA-binding protein H-NS